MKISSLTRDEDLAEITVGDVKQASAVIEALVDYVEKNEWSGPVVTVCSADGDRRGHQCSGCTAFDVDQGEADDARMPPLQ